MTNDKEIKTIRCAIYTRKSTTEGLEKDFTSLDAQRESAESYIKSQRNQGWLLLPEKYDDGGFTGATTDRPALQRLLQDIRDGKIDCIVIYKVDRLSRSLLDFVKLLQFFDEQQITFVSVTQNFDTNTSMGRLTLNILLSFAQFEREMISERTKDKMGAARMKGKWVGGRPGLGYNVDPVSKQLVVNPEEAQLVREIFDLYLEKKSLLEVAKILNERGYRTKTYKNKNGVIGNVEFKNTNIQLMLNNPTFIGKTLYEGKLYAGLHEPIISEDIFKQVQEIMKQNKRVRGVSKNRKFQGLLSGIFKCGACKVSMCHGYARKKNYKYRYYTCLNAIKRDRKECPTKSISALPIEGRCLQLLRDLSKDVRLNDENWKPLVLEEQIAIFQGLVQTIEYNGNKGKLKICLKNESEGREFDLPLDQIKKKLPNADGPSFADEPPIRRQLLIAHQIQQMLDSGQAKDVKQIAGWLNVSKTRLDQILNLLFLCPKIQEAVIIGDSNRIAKIGERAIRPLSVEINWGNQLKAWNSLLA